MAPARTLWLSLPLTLFACAKPAPSACSSWETTDTAGVERCGEDALVRRVSSPTCSDGCLGDADCETGTLCSCDAATGLGTCEPTGCRDRSDCEAQTLDCISHVSDECGGETVPTFGFHCQTVDDDCALDADCAEGQFCRFVEAESVHRCFDIEAFNCG